MIKKRDRKEGYITISKESGVETVLEEEIVKKYPNRQHRRKNDLIQSGVKQVNDKISIIPQKSPNRNTKIRWERKIKKKLDGKEK